MKKRKVVELDEADYAFFQLKEFIQSKGHEPISHGYRLKVLGDQMRYLASLCDSMRKEINDNSA